MGRPRKNPVQSENITTISPFMLLNAWFRDGNLKSKLPKDIEDGAQFSPFFILSYFIGDPKISIYINNNFNNYEMPDVPMRDILRMMKYIIYWTGYKQPYIPPTKKESNVLCDILRKKFPYYKMEEISMIVDIIDNDKNLSSTVYENFNIRTPTKLKNTKKDFEKTLNGILSKESMLNDL